MTKTSFIHSKFKTIINTPIMNTRYGKSATCTVCISYIYSFHALIRADEMISLNHLHYYDLNALHCCSAKRKLF